MMDEIAEQLARRNRFRRKLAASESPSERFRAMMRLQQRGWDLLRKSPAGYAHFIRRNFKARRVTNRVDAH
jgi:hypothetical protein